MANETTVLMYVPDVDGSSTMVGYDPEPGEEGKHTGWLPIESCSFALERKVTAADALGDEEAESTGASTHVDPMTVKRTADFSSAKLLMWLANAEETGRKKEKVLIDYVAPSGRYYVRYELIGVELVSSSIAYQDPDDASETLVFTYDAIRILQRPIGENGEVDSSKETVAEYVVFEAE